MNVGDKVRLLHGKESGVVTKILERGLVEVEIEDGFSIPVLAAELVVVSSDEQGAFDDYRPTSSKKAPTQTPEKAVTKDDGYYVAIIPLNDKLHSIYLISAVKPDALVLVNELNAKSEERSILSEKLFSGSQIKITERNLDHLNTWPSLSITFLKEVRNWSIAEKPEKVIVKIKSKHFQKGAEYIKSMDKKGYLIPLKAQLHEEVAPSILDTDALKSAMYATKEQPTTSSKQNRTVQREIDLHIEALRADHDAIPKGQILSIQLQIFEQKLNQAIMEGLDEIVFIHGVGSGILKNKIHKYLSKSDHIKFFKDAHKEKFGYGATLIRLN